MGKPFWSGASGLVLWGASGAAALGGFLLFRAWEPAPGIQSTVCLLRRVSGLPCPGCGMTRAFAHLAKGEWAAALADHPLALVIAAELGIVWLAWGWLLAAGSLRGAPRPPRMPAWFERTVLAHLAVLVAFWLGRAATGTLPW